MSYVQNFIGQDASMRIFNFWTLTETLEPSGQDSEGSGRPQRTFISGDQGV